MNKKHLDDYLTTITPTNRTLNSFIGIEKVLNSYKDYENKLTELNKIINLNEKEVKKSIEELFKKNKETFRCLFELIAIRDGKTIIMKDNSIITIDDLINNSDDIFFLFQESGLLKMITNGALTSFNNYFLGVMVGMDTNARKNRGGSNTETLLIDSLESIFLSNDNIDIEYQSYFFKNYKLSNNASTLSKKRIDIVITDKKNNHTFLIEGSFYNSGGSKISETAKSYLGIYNLVKDISDVTFIWVADGNGMKTIELYLQKIFDYGFIKNINQFNRMMRKLNTKTK
ncbi:MAG: DpnII family type II restriction endonuclease [Metamycoplasmataceae bacterium]